MDGLLDSVRWRFWPVRVGDICLGMFPCDFTEREALRGRKGVTIYRSGRDRQVASWCLVGMTAAAGVVFGLASMIVFR